MTASLPASKSWIWTIQCQLMYHKLSLLNISEDAVASQDDVKSWPYLNDVVLPTRLEDCTVNLLIGVDIPEALQPKEIRRGEKGGPFAVKTKFGWTLNGPLGQKEEAAAQVRPLIS